MADKKYPVVCVSRIAYELIQDLEAAHYVFAGTDKKDQRAVDDAYAALNQRRKEVYQYLEGLEQQIEPCRTVAVLRFD